MALQVLNNVPISDDSTTGGSTACSASHGPDEIGKTPATSSDASSVEEAGASWKSNHNSELPPTVERPYTPDEALGDIPGVAYALERFLSSHMLESEEYCHKMDEPKCVITPFQPSVFNLSSTESVYISPLDMGSYNVSKA